MQELPSGTVTFLFTDIEGSTNLWEQHPEGMRRALSRHDTLLRATITSHNGIVFKTIGDGFYAAFADAANAVTAALAAQRLLSAEEWESFLARENESMGAEQVPPGSPGKIAASFHLNVRMALHTGTAVERDHDYFGPTINRVARLLAIGHGGQILLSQKTADAVSQYLPSGISLLGLGEHRLRDLHQSEHVFQLLHPDVQIKFPTLKSLGNALHTGRLPGPLTSFIGREKEQEEIGRLLATTRLLTLIGAGGCGKTRLALETAAKVAGEYPDGVWVVELASLSEQALVPQTVASVLAIREASGQTLEQSLIEHLRAKRLLLILDNCEHLMDASARLVGTLVQGCRQLRILVTSREPLRIAGEQAYRIPSLSSPDPKRAATLETLLRYEAVRLFIDRVRLTRPDFMVTAANAPTIGSLCTCLDGIPLAIELAAARVRSLSVEEIHARLDDRFRLLTGGNRTALPRQQTLRALIDWGYTLLEDREREILRRLSVFKGGWTLEAAKQVCSGVRDADRHAPFEEWEVLDLLTGICDKSLAQADTEGLDGRTRYRLLETVRQYSGEKLLECGEAEEVRRLHRDFYLQQAEDISLKLYGPEQGFWFDTLEIEHDNMRAALAYCEEANDSEAELRLVGALGRFWDTRGYLHEGKERFLRALSRSAEPTLYRAKAMIKGGWIAYLQHEYGTAQNYYGQALEIYEAHKDMVGVAESLHLLAMIARMRGDLEKATELFEQVVELNIKTGQSIASVLSHLGAIAFERGKVAEARQHLERALEGYRKGGNVQFAAAILRGLARYARHDGNDMEAHAFLVECLLSLHSIGAMVDIVPALTEAARLAYARTEWERAGILFGTVEVLHESMNLPWEPGEQAEMTTVRETLQAHAHTNAWTLGRTMELQAVIDCAVSPSTQPHGISAHEF